MQVNNVTNFPGPEYDRIFVPSEKEENVMPELPEIASRTDEMNRELTGKVIQSIEVLQPKCLNLPADEFTLRLSGARFEQFRYRGKWIEGRTDKGWLLINMGMGGELLLVDRSHLPEKYRLIIDFTDATCLS